MLLNLKSFKNLLIDPINKKKVNLKIKNINLYQIYQC